MIALRSGWEFVWALGSDGESGTRAHGTIIIFGFTPWKHVIYFRFSVCSSVRRCPFQIVEFFRTFNASARARGARTLNDDIFCIISSIFSPPLIRTVKCVVRGAQGAAEALARLVHVSILFQFFLLLSSARTALVLVCVARFLTNNPRHLYLRIFIADSVRTRRHKTE